MNLIVNKFRHICQGGMLGSAWKKNHLVRVVELDGPYSCPVCRETGMDMLPFMTLSPEIQDLR